MKALNQSAFLKNPASGICRSTFYAAELPNATENLFFDASGAIALRTGATPVVPNGGSWGGPSGTIIPFVPVVNKMIIGDIKVVRLSGTRITSENMFIRLYRVDINGRLTEDILPIQEANRPVDPNEYVIEFKNTNIFLDAQSGISFESTVEGFISVSFEIKLIENAYEMETL